MPEVGSASLAIIPSFKGFQSDLENGTSKHMAAAGATGGAQFGDSAGKAAGSKFRSHVKSFAKIAAVGLGLASAAAFKFAGDAIDEAREAQKVGALTESTIKATGKAAKVTAKQVGDLAGAISEKSGIDDEVIQRGANMLLTFKNIRNEAGKGNKIFNRTTKATADMAAAMAGGKGGEIDLKSASILLGKALNDPVKGLSALTRVGVQFTDQQKAINKALVEGGTLNAMAAFGTKVTATEFAKIQKENNATTQETVDIIMGPLSRAQEKLFKHYEEGGHALEAQKKILDEVNSQFGGAAAAQATEADKLKVAWGNLKEEVGTELLPVMDDLARFLRKKGIPAAKDFAGWVRDDMIPAVKDFADEIDPVVDGIKNVAKWINKLPGPAKLAGLAGILGGVGYAKLRGGNSMGGGGLLGGVGKAVGLAKPVPVFVTNPGFGGGGLPAGPTSKLGKVGSIASKAAGPVALVGAAAVGLNEFRKWNHEGDSPIEHMFGGKVGQMARDFFDSANDGAKEYNKNLGVVNNAWAKVGNTTDGAREKVRLYDGTIRSLPREWQTVVKAVNLESVLWGARQYKGMLEGIPREVVTTFVRNVRTNNDTGESGDPRFGGFRAHGGSMHPGYGYWTGENGPEYIEPTQRSRITPASQMDTSGGMPRTVILNVDGEQFRAYVDNRINAAGRHPTGRRR